MEYVGNVHFQTRVCEFTCSVLSKFLAIRKDKIWEKRHGRSLSFNPMSSSHFPSAVEIASGKCTCIRMHPGKTRRAQFTWSNYNGKTFDRFLTSACVLKSIEKLFELLINKFILNLFQKVLRWYLVLLWKKNWKFYI